MIVRRLPDGRILADRDVLAALYRIARVTVARRCDRPGVRCGRDRATGAVLYDTAAADAALRPVMAGAG